MVPALADEEKLLRRIELVNVILMGLLPIGAWVLLSAKMALGVFLGAAIVTVKLSSAQMAAEESL